MKNKRKNPEMSHDELIKDIQEVIKRARKLNHHIKVTELIKIHMVFDGDTTKGWVHTHMMWEFFELPDLEIREVSPLFSMPSCGMLLNEIAQYMVDNQGKKEIEPGQNMRLGGSVVSFRTAEPIPGDEEHFKTPRLTVVDMPEAYKCSSCEKGEEGHEHD